MNNATHSGIREAIRDRIVAGEWKLGELIPGEVEFAEEYGCSRTTVNRALQALAEEGIVERKRKGGTRVRPLPARQAHVSIPLLREQVERAGHEYAHRVLRRELRKPPETLRERMRLGPDQRCAYVETLHVADGKAFAFERRWVNLETVPEFADADLAETSANEWLVRTVPFSRGVVALSASEADERLAELFGTSAGQALFTMDRTTWFGDLSVTDITLVYRPGFRLGFEI